MIKSILKRTYKYISSFILSLIYQRQNLNPPLPPKVFIQTLQTNKQSHTNQSTNQLINHQISPSFLPSFIHYSPNLNLFLTLSHKSIHPSLFFTFPSFGSVITVTITIIILINIFCSSIHVIHSFILSVICIHFLFFFLFFSSVS